MASAVQGPNQGRRFTLQSVVEYPAQSSESIDTDSSSVKDKGSFSTVECLSFVVHSNNVKPPLHAGLRPGHSSPPELSSFQAILFVNEKPIGKLLDPYCHLEVCSQNCCGTISAAETVQVAHLFYDKWQAAFASSKTCSQAQPLCIPVHENFRTAQLRIQLIGRQFGQPIALPAYLVSGKKLIASVATQRQLVGYIKQQQQRFSEGRKEVSFVEPIPYSQCDEYCWQCGSSLQGCSFTFDIKDEPAWVKQVEVRVPVSAHPSLDGFDVQPHRTLAISHIPNSCSSGTASHSTSCTPLLRSMATRLAFKGAGGRPAEPDSTVEKVASAENKKSRSSLQQASHPTSEKPHIRFKEVVLRDADFPPLSASRNVSRRSRNSSDQIHDWSSERGGVLASSSGAAVVSTPLHSKAAGVGSGSSQPSGSCAGGSGDPGDDDNADDSSSRRADDGSSSSSSSGPGGGKGGRQGSGGAGGNEDDDEFRDRPQCGSGRNSDEPAEVRDETEAESNTADKNTEGSSAAAVNSSRQDSKTANPAREMSNAQQGIEGIPQPSTLNHRQDAQTWTSSDRKAGTFKPSEPQAVAPPTSVNMNDSLSEPSPCNTSPTYPKQHNGRYPSKAASQINGRHHRSNSLLGGTLPVPAASTDHAITNGCSDAAVLERLLAESPIAFLTQNREHTENGFGDGGSTSSEEGSMSDGTGLFAIPGDSTAAGSATSTETAAQSSTGSVDVFDSTYDFMSKCKYRLPGAPVRNEQLRKQPNRTPNGSVAPTPLSSRTPARRQHRADQDAAVAQNSSRAEALAVHSALPEVQPVPSRDPRGMSDLERFLEQATPYLKLTPSNPDLINTLCLEDVWRFYHEPSLYGREVLTYGGQRGTSFSYFVPYLSAIQLFVPALPGDPGTDKLYECDIPDWHKYMHMVYEFFDRDPPFNRPPMFVRMEMLSNHSADSKVLLRQRIKELHPCSWYAVAWYPVYRIPDAPLTARFLTFHSFAPLVAQRHFPPALDSIPLQVSGLKWYNMMNDRWFENLSESTTRNEQALEEGASRGLRKNYAQSSIDPEWQHHLEELQSTADRLARGVGLRVLGKMGPENVELYHPDWQFFNGRS